MNIYDCVYNNVVDFNNAINSLWPQHIDTIANGNITIGKDYLSNLPPETLIEMMTHLPLESVQALYLAERKITASEPIIQFKTNLKTQELLESFYSFYHRNLTSEKWEIFKEDFERAKTFQNGSNERLQALRGAIYSVHQGNISLETLLYPTKEGFYADQPLVKQLIKNLNADCFLFKYNYDKINDERHNHDKINNEIFFLNLLKTNQKHPKKLNVEILNVSFVPEQLVESLTAALRENQSINKVFICWHDCDLIQLDSILETIKNNERITKFRIRDLGSKKNCSGDESYWEKSAKEKSYKEFEDLIKNKLSSTFQISEKDRYGHFPCERLPV